MDEINHVFDLFFTCNESYDDFYEESREAYVSFVDFAPTVKLEMQDVEQWLSK